MIAAPLATAFFAAVRLGESVKLAVLSRRVTKLAKRFFGVPDFHYYALADGIAKILARCGKGPLRSHGPRPPNEPQQFLFRI